MTRINGKESGLKSYSRLNRRNIIALAVLTLVCVLSCVGDILTGAAKLPAGEIMNCILFPAGASMNTRIIVLYLRLPTALMAVAAGFALGSSGAVMQTILHNPLASPYTLGVGTAAGFGASLAIVLGLGAVGTSFLAFLFAMLISMMIYFLSIRNASGGTLLLSGIACLFLFQALQALLQYGASETQNQSIVFWSFGSLQKTNWSKLAISASLCAAVNPLLLMDAWRYTALTMGDQKAKSLGVGVSRLKIKAFLLISLGASAAVCFTGSIGFIGLAGPHISRMLVGEDQRFYIPVSALCGSALLSVASIVSKLIQPGLIFPIGIVTSIIGVPFFFAVVFKAGRRG